MSSVTVSVKVRTAKNQIRCLFDDQGRKIEDPIQLKEIAIGFYQKLLGCPAQIDVDSLNRLNNLMESCILEVKKFMLQCEVTADEIKKAMFSMKRDKACGLDGYSAHFFKKTWDIVKDDV
uniref:Reverse transcriptase domain-containing protein n=1 Tax=Fagus sylvatica TaxID=28930 RepID=A0A2N9FBM6_FAGSY